MWSVVMLSPRMASGRAPMMSVGRRRRHRHALEIRRVGDVGRSGRPAIGVAAGHLDLLPALVALVDVGVAGAEHVAVDIGVDQAADLVVGRPDVLEIDVLAVAGGADRAFDHVLDHRALDRIGDDERRRGEIVGAHVGADPPLEIAVAGEHRGGDQVVLVDRLADRLGQRPGIADAGGAAIAGEVEAERVQILGQAGLGRDSRSPPAIPARARSSPRACASAPSPAPCAPPARRRSARRGWRCWCSW